MQPPTQPLLDLPKPTHARSPPRGFTDGAAVELFGVAIAVAGLGFGYAAPPIGAIGVAVALIGLMMHVEMI